MTATVYVLPTAQTQRGIKRPNGCTGPICAAIHKGRHAVATQTKPTSDTPKQDDDWSPFGGDAA
ncbi:hypothetical protein ACJJJB_01405 [Microbulbifer sp. ANSA001]|uniref:hypothetical protein n=1 Tax=Microbulbifer sp. ANSA001 TaxID=3243358 RepID=UPI00404393A4